jgi:HK97 family phage portal protein
MNTAASTPESFAAKVVHLRAIERAQKSESRGLHPGSESEIMRLMMGTDKKTGITVNEYSALSSPAVLAAVTNIQQTIAMLPLNVYRRNDDGTKVRQANHPVERILKSEWNPVQTAYDGKCVFVANLVLRGSAYAQQIRSRGGELVELWNISSNRVEVTRKGRDLTFEVTEDNQQKKTLPREELFYVNGFRLEGWKGLSAVDIADRVIGIGLALDYYKRTFFASGGNMRMALEYPGRLTPDIIKRIKDTWGEMHGDETSPSSVAVLENGAQAKVIGISPDQMQMTEANISHVQDVSRVFNITPSRIHEHSNSTLTNIEHQAIEYAQYTIGPFVTNIESAINMQLFTPAEKAQGYFAEFNMEGLLRGDTQSRFTAYGQAIKDGWMTRNEVRARENLDKLAGLDTPLMPLNMAPVNEDGSVQDINDNNIEDIDEDSM